MRIPLFFNQIAAISIVYIISFLLDLQATLWLLGIAFTWIIIGGLIVFQPELRSLVMRTDYAKIFRREKGNDSALPDFNKIKKVVRYLIKVKRGALFVFPRHIDLEHIINSKTEINADLNEELLQSIFEYDTALHDGAVIIHNNKITHAGCMLPMGQGGSVILNLGSRHRAALGLSQNSDALILVISEEIGSVSLVFDGEILYDIGIEKCCTFIEQLMLEKGLSIESMRKSKVEREDTEYSLNINIEKEKLHEKN